MKKDATKAIKYAESKGYQYESTNTKGWMFYSSASGHKIHINPSADESGLRSVMRAIDLACGVGPDPSKKRNTQKIKDRLRRSRELAVEERQRREREVARLLACRASEDVVMEAQRLYESAVRKVREIERLMQAPGSTA